MAATTPYATVDDLQDYLGTEPPADAQRLLARAQDLLDAETSSSFFAVDANGNPTDPLVVTGFSKAVCAQVEFWIANGDELDLLGNWKSYAMAGLSVTREAQARRRRLCDRAQDILAAVRTGTSASTIFSRPLLPGKPAI